MNEIVNNFLLVGDKCMPEIHLKQPGFTYTVYGPFTRNKKKNLKFMQTGNTDFIYRNANCCNTFAANLSYTAF